MVNKNEVKCIFQLIHQGVFIKKVEILNKGNTYLLNISYAFDIESNVHFTVIIIRNVLYLYIQF